MTLLQSHEVELIIPYRSSELDRLFGIIATT
jgi:hypothetical protein